MIQTASDSGNAVTLVFFLFALLYLDGDDVSARPLIERKTRLAALLLHVSSPLHYSDQQRGQGRAFRDVTRGDRLEARRCALRTRQPRPVAQGQCLDREEFVVVGWTDPEGSRLWLGALLLAYYDPQGRLVYAGRAGAGIKQAELERLWRRLQPLATSGRCRSRCRRPTAPASARRSSSRLRKKITAAERFVGL